MNKYGEKIVNKFLDKCKKSGNYKRVFIDFEDGTCLLEDDVKTLEDIAAHYLITYDNWAYNVLCEQVEYLGDNWQEICWFTKNKNYTFEEVKTVIEKCV